MDRMVFFNIAWMKEYKGDTPNDIPVHGGEFVDQNRYGSEIYNFQAYRGKMYGFVEAGWRPKPRHINIARLGASKQDESVSGVIVVWVARHCHGGGTLVVGWYKDATVYRQRQYGPAGSNRKKPDGKDAPYFCEADCKNCRLIPSDKRDFPIPRGEKGQFGRTNIFYAESEIGAKLKTKVLEYIRRCENARCGGS